MAQNEDRKQEVEAESQDSSKRTTSGIYLQGKKFF